MGEGEGIVIHAADRPLVFVDVETTGLDHNFHEIIEIAAVRVAPWGVRTGAFHLRTIPRYPERAQPGALAINGYTPERWVDAVDLREGLREFGALCACAPTKPIIVGHNPRFDLEFIETSCARLGAWFPAIHHHVIDTSTLAWPACVANKIHSLSLGSVCTLHGVSNIGAHGAMRDVERCMAVYEKIVGWRDINLVAPEQRREVA